MDAVPIDDLAAELSISRATLYRLVRRHGLITFKRVGDRRTWIDRGAILPLVALQPKQAASPRPRPPTRLDPSSHSTNQ